MSHPPSTSRQMPPGVPESLWPNRSRALRYDDEHILVGLGCREPQLVGPLRESVLRELIGLGALTRNQWMTAVRRIDPRVTAALHRAVTATMPTDLGGLSFEVHGAGPVATAIGELLPRLGATSAPGTAQLAVTVGAPGARLGTAELRLVVELGCDQVVVGPLLRAGAGPCEHCLNLRRQDADRRWASVWPQVLGTGLHDDEPSTAGELAYIAVGLVGLVARGVVAGRHLPVGAAMSIGSPDGTLRHHLWPAHPRCDCQLADRATA